MTIGELAKRAAIPISTLRFYEKREIISPYSRSAAGYRHYQEGDIPKVRFVRRAQQLGFTLKEIQELLNLSKEPIPSYAELLQIGESKLSEIQKRINDLMRMQKAISQLLTTECLDLDQACPIIDSLGAESIDAVSPSS